MANAIPAVPDLLRERLAAAPGGRLPWVEVMQMALYEPGAGYYRQGVRRIGRKGDFYTSVSVGPLYGALLAEQAAALWQRFGAPVSFALVEQGAHDGTLMHDVLSALKARHTPLFEAVQVFLLEPDPTLAAAQLARLAHLLPSGRLHHLPSGRQLPELCGFMYCNELLDAFPVHRVIFTPSGWQEFYVTWRDALFDFEPGPLSTAALAEEIGRMESGFPLGYTTEINLAMLSWLEDLSLGGFAGELLLADYGHAAREYHLPERSDGTLRRYFQHRSDKEVLKNLGEADLTAHVNFTRLAQAAQAGGWRVEEFIEQGRHLTHCATQLLSQPGFSPDPAWMRQFQTLTHPGHLGHAFQVLVLARGLPPSSHHGRQEAALRRLGMESAASSPAPSASHV